MHITTLQKIGKSVTLSIPYAVLEMLDLKVGSTVSLQVKTNRLIVEKTSGPKYSLAELLAASDYSHSEYREDVHWAQQTARGRELI